MAFLPESPIRKLICIFVVYPKYALSWLYLYQLNHLAGAGERFRRQIETERSSFQHGSARNVISAICSSCSRLAPPATW
jgi:hypothetical protein